MNENQIRERQNLKSVGKPIRKKDAIELLHGKPVFTEDIVPKDALVVKILHSPYANAIVKSVDKTAAMKIPGMVGIYTYDDVPHKRFTNAGQTYPEMSPYDMYLAEKHVRFVGDVVAIVAGETEKAVDKAMKLIRVDYEVLEPVLDFRTALDNPVIVHPEDDWKANVPVGEDQMRNLVAHSEMGDGDFDAVLQDCDIVLKRTYHVKAAQQVYMETLRTYSEIDPYGRLHVISSTQIVFHCRRIIANALDIPKSKVRVEKPRIGGGFGAKQTAVIEM
jgi:CO/xanthine dehydrogenase Mo-binding subunit